MVFFCMLLGATLGSFANMLVWRLPRQENWITGHSYCPNCGHELEPLDLIPIISYIALGGKCRYCHKPISPRYLIIELLMTGLFVLCPILYGSLGLHYTVAYAVTVFFFMCLSVWDIETMEVPALFLYIPLAVNAFLFYHNYMAVLLALGTFTIAYLLLWMYHRGTVHLAGDGDIYAIAALAFLLPPQSVMYFLIITCFFALVYAILRKSDKLPMIPFLFAGYIVTMLLLLVL